jgi:hypothetical protein
MIFGLFLVSVVTLELILRHDEKRHGRKHDPSAQTPGDTVAVTESVISLAHALERHGRPVRPDPLHPEDVQQDGVRVTPNRREV